MHVQLNIRSLIEEVIPLTLRDHNEFLIGDAEFRLEDVRRLVHGGISSVGARRGGTLLQAIEDVVWFQNFDRLVGIRRTDLAQAVLAFDTCGDLSDVTPSHAVDHEGIVTIRARRLSDLEVEVSVASNSLGKKVTSAVPNADFHLWIEGKGGRITVGDLELTCLRDGPFSRVMIDRVYWFVTGHLIRLER